MKKLIFIVLLLALATQSYGYQYRFINYPTIVFADLFTWQVREGSADNWGQTISPAGTTQTADLLDAPFNWNKGFRIGIGQKSPDNNWDTLLYWTSYQTKATSSASGLVYSAFVANYFANNTNGADFGPFYNNANILWRFTYNTVDIQLGREFKIDQSLDLHPYVGIKTAVINQTIHSTWQSPNTKFLGIIIPITTFSTATETLKNNFDGIGPSIGLNTTWPIFESSTGSFNLFGNFIGALLYGHWRFRDYYQNNTPVSITVNVSSVDGAAPMTGALVGIEWNKILPKSNLNIRLGYEMQAWFNQVQYYSLNMGRLNSIMSLQGGTLSFSYQFN